MRKISSSKIFQGYIPFSVLFFGFAQWVWWINIVLFVACLAALTRFLAISFLPGLGIGFSCAAFLFYQRARFGSQSLTYARAINFIVLFTTILIVSYYLWNSLLKEQGLAIAKYVVLLFFLLGLSAVGILLKMVDTAETSRLDHQSRIRDLMSGPSLFLSFCVAAIVTDLTLIVFFLLDEAGNFSFVYQKFLQRGIIPPICLVLFYWEAVLLLGKYYLGRKTLQLQRELADNQLIILWREYRKVQRGKTKLSQESLVKKFVDLAWQANETFYFFPRYINWAIPILGFIGTVLGISLAASEIGKLVGSANLNIGDSINAAMQPLGIAFDTTLIALSLSVFLAFIYTILQRWEEQRFLFLEEHITHIK